MLSLRTASLALLFLCSCATVNTRVDERIVARGELVSSETTRHPASDLLRLHASSCRDKLTISGTVLKACRRSTQQRVAVDRDIVREAPAAKYEAIAAALLVGGGALLASQTAYGCADSNPPQCSGSEPLYWTGIGMAYAGVGLGLASVIDAQRARDTKERVQSIEASNMLEWCGEEPAKGRGVSAVVAGLPPLSGRFDDTGTTSVTVPAPVSVVAISVDGAPSVSTPVREMCSRELPVPPTP